MDCALALGFEQMKPGSLGTNWPDRPSPLEVFVDVTQQIEQVQGQNKGPFGVQIIRRIIEDPSTNLAPRMFSNGAQEYFNKYGGTKEHLAKIGRA